MGPFILASASPRRKELLKQIGIEAEVMASDIKEEMGQGIPVREMVQILALKKAETIANIVSGGLIIGADTVVVQDNTVLGKPRDYAQAVQMLSALSGKTHRVITGVAVLKQPEYQIVTGFEETRVIFRALTQEEIAAYVHTGEAFDKAGGYGIQGKGALLVERIEGDYFNVVGLPLQRLNLMLAGWGINLLQE